MRPPWTRIWSLTLSTSSPHTHTRDGAKTHVSPSVIPPHCGATGNDVDGSCSGPGGTFVPDTLSLGVPTRQRGPLRQAGWDSGSTASSRAARGPRRTGRPRAARGSHLQGHKPQRWGWPSDPPLGAACECGLPGRAGGAADRPPPPGGNAGKYPLCLRSWAERPHWPRPLVAGHGDRRLSALSSAAQRPGTSHTARPATLKCPRAGGALPAARQPCDLPRGWGAALRAW